MAGKEEDLCTEVFLSSFCFVPTTVLLLISSISLDFILSGKGQFNRLRANMTCIIQIYISGLGGVGGIGREVLQFFSHFQLFMVFSLFQSAIVCPHY